jgi:hypothetical protein
VARDQDSGTGKRRRRTRRPPGAAPGKPAAPGGTLGGLVAAAAHDAFRDARGHATPPSPFPVTLSLTLVPGAPWRAEAAPPLEEQVRRAVLEAAAAQGAFQQGRLWCYRCESAACGHALPPAPDRVFGGYGATGIPRWPTLAELLLERRHPGVGALYDARGRDIAAAFVPAEELNDRQLSVFGRGSKTYAILGQAVVGLLPLRAAGAAGREPERTAFTLQAVESRSASGGARIGLNVIGRLGDGSQAVEALEGPLAERVLNVFTVARRRLRHLVPAGGKQRTVAGAETAERAAAVLRDAVRALERLGRQGTRRTRHAEERGLERRPTGNAREDALAAPPEALLRDGRRGTVVVLGPNHRVHVFSPEGRHITSLLLDGEAARRRQRRERWEPLDPGARAAFRAALGSGEG